MMWQCKPSLLAISIIMLSGCASNLNPQQQEALLGGDLDAAIMAGRN